MNIFRKTIVDENAELATLKTQHEELLTQFESVKEELKTAQEAAAHYQLEYTSLNEQYEELKAENETLKEENVVLASQDASLELRAAEKAAEIVSDNIGTEPVSITDDGEDLDIKEGLATLQGKELVEFYNKHKQEIFKSLKN